MGRRVPSSSPATRRVLAAGVIGAIACVVPATARADAESVVLRFESHGTCPSEADFLAAVRSYTTRWSLVPDGTPAARRIRVRVSDGPGTPSGQLVVASTDGAPTSREISGPSCAAVSRALAVMVAVAIDPRAGMHEEPEKQPDPALEDDAAPAPSVAPAPDPNVTRDVPRPPPSKPTFSGRALRVAVDVRAELSTAVIDRVLPVGAASMILEPARDVGSAWLRAWRPSLAIGVRQSLPGEKTLEGGTATFLWTTGHLRACPFRLSIESVVELSPCIEANVGRLGASADGFPGSRSASMVWTDVGASMWATVNLSKELFLSSTVMLVTPLARQPFTLATGETIARVPPRGFLGGIGLGLRL